MAIALVDPYGSGRFLLDELRQRGWPCVAVRSSFDISASILATWNAVPFDRVVVHRGDLSKTAGELRAHEPPVRAVAAGCDLGAGLADALAEELGLPGNGTELSRCRADRSLVQERLLEHGIRSCRQKRVSSESAAIVFAKELGYWPLVAKSCSASSSGASTFRCDDEEALTSAVEQLLKEDRSSAAIVEVLVQEAVVGVEYLVDCVSVEGRHLIMGLWMCERTHTDCSICADRAKTLPYDDVDGGAQHVLREYVFSCLAALDVCFGASTCNVIVDDQGPCLVDVAQRMQNGVGPALWAKCVGRERGQAHLWADLLTNNGREVIKCLDAVAAGEPAYVLSSFSLQLDLQCPEEGVLERSIEDMAGHWIRSLPSFWKSKFFVEEADRVKATCDMLTSPGYVILVGKDPTVVERDAAEIRRKEREGGVYALRSAPMTKTASLPSPKNSVGLTHGDRRLTLPIKLQASGKMREMELQMESMLSPLVSRAASPQLSPQCAPKFAPSLAADGLEDFSLGDGAEDDDLDFDLGEAEEGEPADFLLNGLTPCHGDLQSPLLGITIGGPAAEPPRPH